MSLNEILVPNVYNLDSNSLSINSVTSNPGSTNTLWENSAFVPPHLFNGSVDLEAPAINYGIGFHSTLFGNGTAITIPTATDVFISNYGPIAADDNNYASASFNLVTGIFTIPISGFWHFSAGILYTTLSGADSTITLGIAPPGNIGNAEVVSSTFGAIASGNYILNTSTDIYVTAGSQLQVYTRQNSGNSQQINIQPGGSTANFFSGFLISTTNSSPV
jgi:hypothetical protein